MHEARTGAVLGAGQSPRLGRLVSLREERTQAARAGPHAARWKASGSLHKERCAGCCDSLSSSRARWCGGVRIVCPARGPCCPFASGESQSAAQTLCVWADSSPQFAALSAQEPRSSSAMSGGIHARFLRWLNGEELQPALRADRIPEGRNCGSRSATQTLRVWADSSPQSAQGRRVERVDIARALVGLQQEFCDVGVDPRPVPPLAERRGGVARAARGPDSRGARLWLTIGYPNAVRLGR